MEKRYAMKKMVKESWISYVNKENRIQDKEYYQKEYFMIKGSICQEDIAILNMYAPNNTASKYHKAKIDRTVTDPPLYLEISTVLSQ